MQGTGVQYARAAQSGLALEQDGVAHAVERTSQVMAYAAELGGAANKDGRVEIGARDFDRLAIVGVRDRFEPGHDFEGGTRALGRIDPQQRSAQGVQGGGDAGSMARRRDQLVVPGVPQL